jgi:hypothetical protein
LAAAAVARHTIANQQRCSIRVSYDLEGLGGSGFQDLAASLAVAVFGPAVEVMGAGRDGGRDMYIDGPLIWDEQTIGVRDENDGSGEAERQGQSETWSGYTVFQGLCCIGGAAW